MYSHLLPGVYFSVELIMNLAGAGGYARFEHWELRAIMALGALCIMACMYASTCYHLFMPISTAEISLAGEEPVRLEPPLDVVIRPLCDQLVKLLAEGQNHLRELLEAHSSVPLGEPMEHQSDVLGREQVPEAQDQLQAVHECLVRQGALRVDVEHAEAVDQVEVRLQGQVDFGRLSVTLDEHDLLDQGGECGLVGLRQTSLRG